MPSRTHKNLAVIPARAGSTRLKNKNIYPLLGKPLIRWITEAVVNSNYFDEIIISTDSDEIFETVFDLNVVRYQQPVYLAETKITVLEAMLYLLRKSINIYDTFSYFLPTCPFTSSDDIISGINMLNIDRSTDFVVSMTEIKETLQLACLMNGSHILPVFDNLEQGMTNSKFLKKYYKPSGGFYMAKWDSLLKYENFFRGNVKGVLVPEERAVDINTINDIKYAEAIRSGSV